jgi:hypothetical protein
MYLKQLNEGDIAYINALDDVINRIDLHFIKLEREQIGDAYDAGNRTYANAPEYYLKGTNYYDQKYN